MTRTHAQIARAYLLIAMCSFRCPSDKKPKSSVSAVAISIDENALTVGCENGSLHGMKISQGGVGIQHCWSNEPGGAGAAVLAMDVSTDGQARRIS